MTITLNQQPLNFKSSQGILVGVVAVFSMLLWTYNAELESLVEKWNAAQEFSYGYLIPIITAYLVWQKRQSIAHFKFNGSWGGVLLAMLGGVLFAIGKLGAIQVLEWYSFIVVIYGIVLSITGWKAFRKILFPLLILLFMVPLPQFFIASISSKLQLLSSELGVFIIRSAGISVYLTGNIIDLGHYKLQVVDACSGLRYLFPLLVFGFIIAYMFSASWWKRTFVFLSAVPITIFMNSLRIGLIGISVEYWGEGMAEGFLHDFEGWLMFMASTLVMLAEIWVFYIFSRDKKGFLNSFRIDDMPSRPKSSTTLVRHLPMTFYVNILVVITIMFTSITLNTRSEDIPNREQYISFPTVIDEWQGEPDRLDQISRNVLKLDDYALLDYRNDKGHVINFYSAYYSSQRTGVSIHSPKTCLPGGGAEIVSSDTTEVTDVTLNSSPLRVNRVLMAQGESRQLVYYWFQQRGRVITNEYAVKWYLLVDSLFMSRTDGALVRVTTPLSHGEEVEDADKRIEEFIRSVVQSLDKYIPS
jgi:exosortase D (VPLPA-CTERM-specific)